MSSMNEDDQTSRRTKEGASHRFSHKSKGLVTQQYKHSECILDSGSRDQNDTARESIVQHQVLQEIKIWKGLHRHDQAD